MYCAGVTSTGDSLAMKMQFTKITPMMKISNSALIITFWRVVRGLMGILAPSLLSGGGISTTGL